MFVMHGSEPGPFAWSHHDILPGAKTKTDQNFQNPSFLYSNLHQTGMDSRPLAIGRPLVDLIKLKNKMEKELFWKNADQCHAAVVIPIIRMDIFPAHRKKNLL